MAARVGLVLSGCGVMDGSEIHEAVSLLIALDRRGARIVCMAPDIPQSTTINHLTKKPEAHPRRVLDESARIARGNVHDIATISADALDALVFPGGYGAAKNLSTFAVEGAECRVNDQIERLVREVHRARKPIGMACIAPVIAARLFGSGVKVTIGTDRGTADAIRSMGAEHQEVGETEVCIDEANRLVTTPCYMNNVGPWIVYQGAEKMVEELLRLAEAR